MDAYEPPLTLYSRDSLIQEVLLRTQRHEAEAANSLTREERARIIRTVWRDLAAIKADTIRNEFMQVTSRIGLAHITAPKTLRHTFATILQDANVDPLIRNELMGHVPAAASSAGAGLAMTAVYTHTRPETKRQQLEQALANRPALEAAKRWLARVRPQRSSFFGAVPDKSGKPPASRDDRMESTRYYEWIARKYSPEACHNTKNE